MRGDVGVRLYASACVSTRMACLFEHRATGVLTAGYGQADAALSSGEDNILKRYVTSGGKEDFAFNLAIQQGPMVVVLPIKDALPCFQ